MDTKEANDHQLQQQFSDSLIEAHSFDSLKQQSETSELFLTAPSASQVCSLTNESSASASIGKDDSTQASVLDIISSSLSNNHNEQQCASMMNNQISHDLSHSFKLTTQDNRTSIGGRLEATVVTNSDYNCDSNPDITITSSSTTTPTTSTNVNCVTDITTTCEQIDELTSQNGQLMMLDLANIGDNQDICEQQQTANGKEMNETTLQNKD